MMLRQRAQAQANPQGLAWRGGFAQWLPIQQVPELLPATPPVPQYPSAPVQAPGYGNGAGYGGTNPAFRMNTPEVADEVDYRLSEPRCSSLNWSLIELESAVAEAGAMMYKASYVEMDTLFGDGSRTAAQGGLMDKLLGAGKEAFDGESSL